jgi:hypothetical protein
LEAHFVLFAASRALWSDGSRSAIRMAIMPITTSSSTSVKADDLRKRFAITDLSFAMAVFEIFPDSATPE